MADKTKREVLEEAFEEALSNYDTALPDDLPTIPESVSQVIKEDYGSYSLLDELIRAMQDNLSDSTVSIWIGDNESLFAEAWSRGVWKVEETGQATDYED